MNFSVISLSLRYIFIFCITYYFPLKIHYTSLIFNCLSFLYNSQLSLCTMGRTPPSAPHMIPHLLISARRRVRWYMLHMEMKLLYNMPKGRLCSMIVHKIRIKGLAS